MEIEIYSKAAQNNVVRTNYLKTKIDTLQNCRRRLYTVGEETVNLIINECSKQAQKKYKTKHHWLGKVIHWELCKKLKFDYSTTWYMHKK